MRTAAFTDRDETRRLARGHKLRKVFRHDLPDDVFVNAEVVLYNPQNGFTPTGAKYSEAFTSRFQTAVGRGPIS